MKKFYQYQAGENTPWAENKYISLQKKRNSIITLLSSISISTNLDWQPNENCSLTKNSENCELTSKSCLSFLHQCPEHSLVGPLKRGSKTVYGTEADLQQF